MEHDITILSQDEPGILYTTNKSRDLQTLPLLPDTDPDVLLWQEQALKQWGPPPPLTPLTTRRGHTYNTTWTKGVPITHCQDIQVHTHRDLGIEGRLAVYELVGPRWQLNILNVHVPFGEATAEYLDHVMEAYRRMAVIGPTIVIRDFNAAPTNDDTEGAATPEETAVRAAMQHMGLTDITASLQGQPLHRPPQPRTADSRIDLCYADTPHITPIKMRHHDLPSKTTGHRPYGSQHTSGAAGPPRDRP